MLTPKINYTPMGANYHHPCNTYPDGMRQPIWHPEGVDKANVLYIVSAFDGDGNLKKLCKIGVTKDCDNRLKTLATSSPFTIMYMYKFFIPDRNFCYHLEKLTHEALKNWRWNGEWFGLYPHTPIETVNSIMSSVERLGL